ncbi:hypothetical protein JYK21_13620 [Ralstonia pickettii]|nr:hypothetical protein [Ralstonia pickettii]
MAELSKHWPRHSCLLLVLTMDPQSDGDRALAATLLHDAQLAELSEATRVSAAFEAGFRYLASAAATKLPALQSCAPSKIALSQCFECLQCSQHDRRLGDQLMEWFERRYNLPSIPCTADAAVSWAKRMSRLAGL